MSDEHSMTCKNINFLQIILHIILQIILQIILLMSQISQIDFKHFSDKTNFIKSKNLQL